MNRKKEIQKTERSNASGLIQKLYEKEKELEGLKRELEIEAALERVRARTMEMHKSEELAETAAVLFEQVKGLGAAPERMNIGIVKEDDGLIDFWSTDQGGAQINQLFKGSINEPTTLSKAYNAWKTGKRSIVIELKGRKLSDWLNYNQKEVGLPFKKDLIHERRVHTISFFTHGMIIMSTPEPLASTAIDLLERFAGVFKLTYTRFLDLQKAEEQAREAQIEAALERVRARAMGMHSSEELLDVANQLYKELFDLGVPQYMTGFVGVDEPNQTQEVWVTAPNGERTEKFFLPLKGDIVLRKRYNSWKKRESIFHQKVSGKALQKHMTYVSKHFGSEEAVEIGNQFPDSIIFYCGNFPAGYLHILSEEKLDIEQESVFLRFTQVFAMTYRRFQDLKNAEAQTREAQIEISLERIRAKAMAMHSSEDISEATTIVFSELEHLGIKTMRCGIGIMDNNWGMEAWTAASKEKKKEVIKIIGQFDMTKHPALRGVYEAWKNQQDYFSYNLFGKDAQKYYDYVNKRPDYSVPKSKSIVEKHTLNIFNFLEGALFAFTEKPLDKDSISILQKFTSVFSLTYRRYLDLIKAEAQAREAQIEAALERVRGSAMALRHSDELRQVISIIFEEITKLGMDFYDCNMFIIDKTEKVFTIWGSELGDVQLLTETKLATQAHPVIRKMYLDFKKGIKYSSIKVSGKKLKDYQNWLVTETEYRNAPREYQEAMMAPDQIVFSRAYMNHGLLEVAGSEQLPDDKAGILERFAKVVDLTYTRFDDLVQAEEQAREAQIEAALERVRAQAMAMQQSEDLNKTTSVLLEELEQLDLEVMRCGLGIVNPLNYHAKIYSTTKTDNGNSEILTGTVDLSVHPAWRDTMNAWEKQQFASYVLEGKELTDYYQRLKESGYNFPRNFIKNIKSLKKQYYYNAIIPKGGLFVIANSPVSLENLKILQRFADVFNLTYTRYEDLQNAEKRALEAVRQASLDRVRGVIASMRSKEDLNRITPLIWKELTTLGVSFIRCGVFIMDVENEVIQSYLSTPDGKTLGIFNLPFTSELIGEQLVDSWHIGKIYKEHWTKARFIEFMQRLKDTGQLEDTSSYQGAAAPPDKLDLHFIPFKQGMIYVGNTEPLTKDELELVSSLAETFSIAYARYEDFRELEIAKNQIESTLNELKSTQSQLIHSEKMASLGELTAGIAHEIQNPLNFVNNFSEVSVDLIEELKGERKKAGNERDGSLEQEILDDVIQNLEKINHHGHRASSIVKGMLEHSRTGSKEKQLTDLNALADEYLRLAYHGLRAKDKSFNADFRLEKDNKLPKVKVIPQDIGRVLLNLINNAFFTVSQKAKEREGGFVPTVIISTETIKSLVGDPMIEIRVKDNGNGIPRELKDKIFQPFFTTKPSGKGTGLGLSLSYDIIKAHGGEIMVESKEGEGTEFTIVLGINTH